MTHYPIISHYKTMKPVRRQPRVNRWAFILTTLACMIELHEARTTRDLINDTASHVDGLWRNVLAFGITLAVSLIIATIAQSALADKKPQPANTPSQGRLKHIA